MNFETGETEFPTTDITYQCPGLLSLLRLFILRCRHAFGVFAFTSFDVLCQRCWEKCTLTVGTRNQCFFIVEIWNIIIIFFQLVTFPSRNIGHVEPRNKILWECRQWPLFRFQLLFSLFIQEFLDALFLVYEQTGRAELSTTYMAHNYSRFSNWIVFFRRARFFQLIYITLSLLMSPLINLQFFLCLSSD